MSRNAFVYAVVIIGAAAFAAGGVWSFGWPHAFFTVVAHYPPYNAHLFHDLGAFQLGIATALAAGLWWRDALGVGLAGGTVGMVLHAVSHVRDDGLASGSWEMWALVAAAVLFVAALVVRARRPG